MVPRGGPFSTPLLSRGGHLVEFYKQDLEAQKAFYTAGHRAKRKAMGKVTAQPCKANIPTCDTAFGISTLTHTTEEGFKEEKKWNADQA